MSQIFVRAETISDRIYDVKLYLEDWKILFALNGIMESDQLASFLEFDEKQVNEGLERLKELNLINPIGEDLTAETSEMTDFDLTTSEEDLEIADEEEIAEPAQGKDKSEADEIDSLLEDTDTGKEEESMEEFEFDSLDESDQDLTGDIDEDIEDEFKDFEEKAEDSDLDESIDENLDALLGEDTAEDEEEESLSEDLGFMEDEESEALDKLDSETAEEDTLKEEEDEERALLDKDPESEKESGDEDLDQLINDLLKEESEEESETPDDFGESGEKAEEREEETPDTPAESKESREQDFNLGEIFETDLDETEQNLDEMIDTFETPEVSEAEDIETEIPAAPKVEGEKTILVVDDSVVIRKMVEIALENEKYEIVTVANGKDALSYLDKKEPSIVILDIMLPDVNGLDILKAIKASKNIPVVMLSAKDTPRETSKAKELGADDFIPKPFKDEELINKIHELIGE